MKNISDNEPGNVKYEYRVSRRTIKIILIVSLIFVIAFFISSEVLKRFFEIDLMEILQ